MGRWFHLARYCGGVVGCPLGRCSMSEKMFTHAEVCSLQEEEAMRRLQAPAIDPEGARTADADAQAAKRFADEAADHAMRLRHVVRSFSTWEHERERERPLTEAATVLDKVHSVARWALARDAEATRLEQENGRLRNGLTVIAAMARERQQTSGIHGRNEPWGNYIDAGDVLVFTDLALKDGQ